VDVVPVELLAEGLRAVGMANDHPLHPGEAWVQESVAGGALTLGFGLLPDVAPGAFPEVQRARPEEAGLGPEELPGLPSVLAVPLPAGLLEEVGVDARQVWRTARRRLDHLAELAAERQRRRPQHPLRPLAEADVVTLLGSARFRRTLAGTPQDGHGGGLVGLVVPMRTRGWISSSSLDPAFGPAAAAATSLAQRGFLRPLLVTADEVVQVPPGGHPLRYLGQRPGGD
jgi:hypothetical protein